MEKSTIKRLANDTMRKIDALAAEQAVDCIILARTARLITTDCPYGTCSPDYAAHILGKVMQVLECLPRRWKYTVYVSKYVSSISVISGISNHGFIGWLRKHGWNYTDTVEYISDNGEIPNFYAHHITTKVEGVEINYTYYG